MTSAYVVTGLKSAVMLKILRSLAARQARLGPSRQKNRMCSGTE